MIASKAEKRAKQVQHLDDQEPNQESDHLQFDEMETDQPQTDQLKAD